LVCPSDLVREGTLDDCLLNLSDSEESSVALNDIPTEETTVQDPEAHMIGLDPTRVLSFGSSLLVASSPDDHPQEER
jgi:hypothetical protein